MIFQAMHGNGGPGCLDRKIVAANGQGRGRTIALDPIIAWRFRNSKLHATKPIKTMFLIRLLLRLVLLFFLAICVSSAWHQTDWATRLLLAFISGLLVAGIYALRYLRSMEHSKYAAGNSSLVWQFMWSDKTPFFPKVSREPMVFQVAGLFGSPPLLSPGFHIISARLIPMTVSLLFLWMISIVFDRYWNLISGALQQMSGIERFDIERYWFLAMVLFYAICYLLVKRLFIKRVPATCMTEGCRGQAFLGTEIEGPEIGRRRKYQYIYSCNHCKGRHTTGVWA